MPMASGAGQIKPYNNILRCSILAKCDTEGKPMLRNKNGMGCHFLFLIALAIKDPAQFPVGEVGVVVSQVGQQDAFFTDDVTGNYPRRSYRDRTVPP